MAALRRLAQHVQHAGLNAQRKIAPNTDAMGDAVGNHKTDAMDLPRQRIRIFSDLGDGLGAKDSVDPQCQRRPDAMSLEKNHDVLHAALLLPSLHDPARAHLADPFDFQNAQRLLRENLQRVQSECPHQALRIGGADAFDEAGAEIFFDAFDGRRIDFVPVINLELQAITRMALPRARDLDLFPFRYGEDRAYDRRSWTAVGIQAGDGVMVFRIMVSDPADGALQG